MPGFEGVAFVNMVSVKKALTLGLRADGSFLRPPVIRHVWAFSAFSTFSTWLPPLDFWVGRKCVNLQFSLLSF
jgi:hypothetical protein